MTDEETILIIKGAISELPPELKKATLELAEFIRMNVKKAGSPVGPMALALVGAEMQKET
jgi:hypothetical protein